jgi:hypothetical protein
MKMNLRILSGFVIVFALAGLDAELALADGDDNGVLWSSLGLSQSASDLAISSKNCSRMGFAQKLEPSALWSLDFPFTLERLKASRVPSPGSMILASPILAKALSVETNLKGTLVFPFGSSCASDV